MTGSFHYYFPLWVLSGVQLLFSLKIIVRWNLKKWKLSASTLPYLDLKEKKDISCLEKTEKCLRSYALTQVILHFLCFSKTCKFVLSSFNKNTVSFSVLVVLFKPSAFFAQLISIYIIQYLSKHIYFC